MWQYRWVLILEALEWSLCKDGSSPFGDVEVIGTSAECASVEYEYHGETPLSTVFIYAKRPTDMEFIEWGSSLEAHPMGKRRYRTMIQALPKNEQFEVRVANSKLEGLEGTLSPISKTKVTKEKPYTPDPPQDLEMHRTDPRTNTNKPDGSVCIDVHWSHALFDLKVQVTDVFFRISRQYVNETPTQVCLDKVGSRDRECGTPIKTFAALPQAYVTACGLRPNRHLSIKVEAFSCDRQFVSATIETITPPSAPSVVHSLVTAPGFEQSIAGFRPVAVVDWIPQHDDLVEGYAIYQSLVDISAMKLLCWVPSSGSSYAKGHLELPIVHKNHTYSENSWLLRDYGFHFHVHQEQEIMVTARVKCNHVNNSGRHLESPPYTFRLGSWLVLDEEIKCLTSFGAIHPQYVSHPIELSWTQEQALSSA